jgi:hypothetical protein
MTMPDGSAAPGRQYVLSMEKIRKLSDVLEGEGALTGCHSPLVNCHLDVDEYWCLARETCGVDAGCGVKGCRRW